MSGAGEIAAGDKPAGRFDELRKTIESVRGRSLASCGESDRKRAADRMGRLIGGKPAIGGDVTSVAALFDLAMFEPNDRGVRPIDRFISGSAERLSPSERDIARRLGAAIFSCFTIIAAHDEEGAWVDDVLDHDRRLWIADLSITGPAAIGQTFAARIFDAGPFHATIGPLTPAAERLVRVFRKAIETGGRSPFRRSLAAITYGAGYISETGVPTHPGGKKFAADLYDGLVRAGEISADGKPGA